MKKLYVLIASLFLFAFLAFFTTSVQANLGYQGGEYTNLCGTGTAATADTCNQGCNTGSGSCSSNTGNTVVKWQCDGKQTDCRSNESSWNSSQSIGNPGCGKTVQIDVFGKNCRENGSSSWSCNDTDLKDYIVWYSGDCTTPTPPTPPSCNYSSTQARVQRNLSDPWDTSKTINFGDQIRVGGFHDGTGLLNSDTSLSVSGIGNVGNGSFITPSTSGTYTLTVTTPGQSGSACQDTASFVVQAAACVPDGSCSASAPVCGQTTTGVDNCGNACSKQGSACPAQGGNISITNNPTNTITNNPTNTITFGNVGTSASQPVVVQPQVAGVTVATLPKTGLPAIAWSALAFIPAGFRMRGFRKIKKDLEDDPQFIWEERQFKSGA